MGMCALSWARGERKEAVNLGRSISAGGSIVADFHYKFGDSGGVIDKAGAVNINRVFM